MFSGRAYLPIAVLNYIGFRNQILSGYNKNSKLIDNKFISPMLDLDTDNNYMDMQILDVSSICKKAQKIINIQWKRLTCIVGA